MAARRIGRRRVTSIQASRPLPGSCPDCDGPLRRRRVFSQQQEDLPIQRPVVHEFRVAVGHCRQCHRRVQERHPLQTSDALGAAASQLGPQAVALAAILNKQCGLSFGRIVHLLEGQPGHQPIGRSPVDQVGHFVMMACGADRRHETAVRLAMGASRGRLIREHLVETAIVAVAGMLRPLLVARVVMRCY
jgi:hypothetical protein